MESGGSGNIQLEAVYYQQLKDLRRSYAHSNQRLNQTPCAEKFQWTGKEGIQEKPCCSEDIVYGNKSQGFAYSKRGGFQVFS